MPAVITLIIAMFLILMSWTWHNLGEIEKTKKVFIIIGLSLISFLVTIVVFNISKNNITYNSQNEMEIVRNVIVALFTIINGLIVMPGIAKIIGGVFNKDIDRQKANRKLVILFIIFVIVLFIECGYMKNIQQGILNIYAMKK